MFGSQALDTGIGLALLMFVLASISSTIVELGVRASRKRSTDLERALRSLLTGTQPKATDDDGQAVWDAFTSTSVYAAAKAARGDIAPAYLSAKAFADGIVELVDRDDGSSALTGPLRDRVRLLVTTIDADLTQFRAGLERWYDEAMAGLTAQYRRWSAIVLLVVGFVLAALTNASLPHVARQLWLDPVARDAAVAAAGGVTAPGTAPGTALDQIGSVFAQARGLAETGLPVGWSPGELSGLDLTSGAWHVLGWAMTAVLVSLGAPFWFDLLGRLTAVRSPRPPEATDDPTSASRAVLETKDAPATPSPAATRFWARAASAAAVEWQAPSSTRDVALGHEEATSSGHDSRVLAWLRR